MTPFPTGTVTFLFTDIEGSTQRWESQRAAMERALDRHNALVRGAVDSRGGYVFHTAGDALCVAFASASGALAAAVEAQRALATEDWSAFAHGFQPLRVRMALHTGTAELREGDYFGPPLNRTARLMATGHGGQILLSLATEQLVRDELPAGVQLRDLGVHRLKDLRHSEHIFRLVVEDLPDVATPPDTAAELRPAEREHFDAELLPAECPYRGLFAFREEDAAFFFGRETFADLLVEAVGTSPMVGVIGPSGSGKSSVVFAGLVPRLRAAPSNGLWHVIELRPGSRPFHALAGALLPLYERRDLTETDHLAETNKLAGYLQDGTVSTRDVLSRIGDKHPDIGRLLIVTDQFEELYTLCPDDRAQQTFQDLLFNVAFHGNGGLPLTLALTLRADFMGHALAYRPFADAMQHHNVILGPMNREELSAAVRLPAERQGRAFETGLVERIVDDVGEKAGSLPLLEFALTKLWGLQEVGWLTHDAYERIGRVEGAVARHADAIYMGLSPDEQQRSRRVFVQLVQPGEGTEDTRRLATHEELAEDWPLVQKLADARLVTTGRDGAGHETAEVVHEALIRSWGQLREWMNADRTFRSWQERLRFALRQWEATGHDEGTLMRGAPLAEAEGWLKERGGELSEGERGYVDAGVDLRDRRTRERQAQLEREAASARMLRQRAVLLAIALVAAGGLGIAALSFGLRAQTATQIATARELAAASASNLSLDPERSALLALQAISVSQSATGQVVLEAERALHLALQYTRLRKTISAHSGGIGVIDVAVSPDGGRLVSCGYDGIKVWDSVNGRQVFSITTPITSANPVAFSPDGSMIASGGPDGVVRLWNAENGIPLAALSGHTATISAVAFSPDGSLLASASSDATVRIWNVATGVERLRLTGHSLGVNSVHWSSDGHLLATGSGDKTARIWDASTGKATLVVTTPYLINSALSPDGTKLATAGYDVRIWDARTGALLNILRGHDNTISEIIFSQDGRWLLTASSDKTAGLWGIRLANDDTRPLRMRFIGHSGLVRGVAFMPNGREVVTASRDGTIKVWDITRSQAWRTLRGHTRTVFEVAFSPDGSRIATASEDGTARIWDLATETSQLTMTAHTTTVMQVAFSPDGRTVATASKDNTARLWNAATGESLRVLAGHQDWVSGVAFSPDGTRLATASKDKTAVVWDTSTGERLLTLAGHAEWVNKVVFDRAGGRIATGSDDNSAKVWDAATGKELLTLRGHTGNVICLSFSPDSSRILTTSDQDHTAKMWDATTGKELFSIASHRNWVEGCGFSPDGNHFATSSVDGTVKLWDSKTGEEILTLAESSGLFGLAFSLDGTHLVVGSSSYTGDSYGDAYVFTLRLDELIQLAHQRLTRTLTDEECRAFLHLNACPPAP